MASHLRKRWHPRFEGMSRQDRRGCFYDAYIADPLAGWDPSITADVAADIADAESAVRALNAADASHVSLEGLARFLLRAESVDARRSCARPVRDDPSIRGWQWPDRPRLDPRGAETARSRALIRPAHQPGLGHAVGRLRRGPDGVSSSQRVPQRRAIRRSDGVDAHFRRRDQSSLP